MEIQIALGADIIMAFDECTEHPAERDRARKSMDLTLGWADRSKKYFEQHKADVPWFGKWLTDRRTSLANKQIVDSGFANDQRPTTHDQTQNVFGIVQGGMYPDLRRECAERLVEMDFPGYAIGGLSVGEPRDLTYEVVNATLPHLPENKPRYLMGVGTPEEIVEYVAQGIDMMDCVLPTRAARHGLLFTSQGKVNIKNSRYALDEGPLDPNCGCKVCSRYSRAYLRHLYAANEMLAQVLNTVHNLAFYLDTMRAVRQSIRLGEFSRFLSGVRTRGLNSPAHT
jgi:queuine tRNA-ribosyltransferase